MVGAPSAIGYGHWPFEGGTASASVVDIFRQTGQLVDFRRGSEICAEGEPAAYFYLLESGAARSFRFFTDGRRHIGAFHLEGEIFGLESGPLHRFSIEAIRRTAVRIVKRPLLVALAKEDPRLTSELWTRTAEALRHALRQVLVLGRQTAEERLTSFLVDMSARCNSRDGLLELPMTGRDIGDYLGLAFETVSRTFTELEKKGVIDRLSRRRAALRPLRLSAIAHETIGFAGDSVDRNRIPGLTARL